MGSRVFVTPIMNTMGPVTDAKHSDLLNTWEEVDLATAKYFTDGFRNSLLDSRGNPVVVSWFPVSWSGFSSNPVKRDFGWFTVYDHLEETWGEQIRRHGDGVYWMYNHPDKSGVGNAWGLDWLHNCHYLNILNRMVLKKNFFPGVVEIPTADTDSSHFVEKYFPFELSNRNSPSINWDNIEADGKRTRDVLKWADAPDDWVPYRPSDDNHQVRGSMRHHIFRLLDIKTRIMTFPEEEIYKAFEAARSGLDVVIAGYEHDFRDRSDAVRELFLQPIGRIAGKYADVSVINMNFQDAARACVGMLPSSQIPRFTAEWKSGYLAIRCDSALFGDAPYIALEDIDNDMIVHVTPERIGKRCWGIQAELLPRRFLLGIAGFSYTGIQGVRRFEVDGDRIELFNGERI